MSSITPVTSAEPRIHEDAETNNFRHRLACLVAEIYATFSQVSQNDRQEITRLEAKYTLATHNSADATIEQGDLAMKIAVLEVFACSISIAVGASNQNDGLFVQKMSDQIPQIAQLFTAQTAANQKNFDGIGQIQLQNLQDKTSRAQSDGNMKESFAQVLQAEIQRLRSASSSSN
jgi:hypothetical protein